MIAEVPSSYETINLVCWINENRRSVNAEGG